MGGPRVPEEAARRREGVAGDVRKLSVPQQDRQQRRRAAAQGVAGADQRELVSAQLRVAVVGERQELLGLDLVVDVLGRLHHSLRGTRQNRLSIIVSIK